MIGSLKRNLSRHKKWEKEEGFKWPAWQSLKLKEIGKFRKENKQIMKHYTETVDDGIRKLLQDQYDEGFDDVENELDDLDIELPEVTEGSFFGVNKQRVDKLIDEIIYKEKSIEKSALRYMDDAYRRTLYKAEIAMSTGAKTLPQAIDMATKDFLNSGIVSIEYKNGRRVNIADYVQMALRTAATRSYLNGAAAKRAELGIDTVLVSQYGACSKTCLPWQGRVYIDDVWGKFEGKREGEMGVSKNGKTYPLLSVAIENGLYHPNCRHSHSTWIEGISKLPKLMDPKKTLENASLEQKQRRIEREIRKNKRLLQGSVSDVQKEYYQKQVKNNQAKLRKFIGEHEDVLRRSYWKEDSHGMSHLPGDVPNQEQHRRYVDRLGKDAPPTIEEFNEIKFEDGDNWKNMQIDYKRRKRLDDNPELALPHADKAIIEEEKFTRYFFGGDFAEGLTKGVAFDSRLGYNINNWKEFRREILEKAKVNPSKPTSDNIYGKHYNVPMILYGKKGKSMDVLTGWQIKEDGARFVTAFPYRKGGDEE